MVDKRIITIAALALCTVPAYNIIKTVKGQDNPDPSPRITNPIPKPADTNLSDALSDAEITVTWNDGTPDIIPADGRPLNGREDCPQCSDTPTKLSEVFIEDPVIAECLAKDGVSDITAVTELYCMDKPVRSLAGLQHFQNLESLGVDHAADVSLDFGSLKYLRVISVSGYHHNTLDFTNTPNLTELYVNKNVALSKLDLTQNINLEVLQATYTNLSTLDLSKNLKLKKLDAADGKLTSLSLPKTDVLEEMSVRDNQLVNLDLSHNSKLIYINVNDNKLESLKLPNTVNKSQLFARSNLLKTITIPSAANFFRVNMSENPLKSLTVKNTAIDELYLSETDLALFDASGVPNLKNLSLGATQITSLDISKNPRLKELILYKTPLSKLNVSNNWEIELLTHDTQTLPKTNIITGAGHPKKWKK